MYQAIDDKTDKLNLSILFRVFYVMVKTKEKLIKFP